MTNVRFCHIANVAFVSSLYAFIFSSPAHAYIINFDTQGLTGPSLATQTTASSITVPSAIGNVTFSGGATLTNEANLPADTSSVYYTSFFLPLGLNPITVTFPTPIENFFLDVYNGETHSDPFTVSDNAGNTNTVMLTSNSAGGVSQIAFAAAGNVVTISTTDTTGFDFSIDNIGFDQTVTGAPTLPGTSPGPSTPSTSSTVPEPASLTIFGLGLVAIGAIRRRVLAVVKIRR